MGSLGRVRATDAEDGRSHADTSRLPAPREVRSARRGTRLAPVTDAIPKILVPFGDRPLLAHQLEYLERNGVRDVAINVSHFRDQVVAFLDEVKTRVAVRVSVEDELLGTVGALLPMRDFLTERFVHLCGDVVTSADPVELVARHDEAGGIATLAERSCTAPTATESRCSSAVTAGAARRPLTWRATSGRTRSGRTLAGFAS